MMCAAKTPVGLAPVKVTTLLSRIVVPRPVTLLTRFTFRLGLGALLATLSDPVTSSLPSDNVFDRSCTLICRMDPLLKAADVACRAPATATVPPGDPEDTVRAPTVAVPEAGTVRVPPESMVVGPKVIPPV